MKIQISIITLLFFISCKKTDTKQATQNPENKTQSVIKSKDTRNKGKVEFEKYSASGIIIYQNNGFFNENLKP